MNRRRSAPRASSGLQFYPWTGTDVEDIGAAAGLRRIGPIVNDSHRNALGDDQPRLVWHYPCAVSAGALS